MLYIRLVRKTIIIIIMTFFSFQPSSRKSESPATFLLESDQDFLIKLGIKPLMYLVEISTFSLNNVIVRRNKIMNNLAKILKILSFKVIFQCLKYVESFQKKFLWRIFD